MNDGFDNLCMMLGKKLGRLDISSVDMLDKVNNLNKKFVIIEEALTEEQGVEEFERKNVAFLQEVLDKLLTKLIQAKSEKELENVELRKKIRYLRRAGWMHRRTCWC